MPQIVYRHIFNEPSKEMDEPMEENDNDDDDDGKEARRRRRAERRAKGESGCRCGAPRTRRRRRRRIRSQNPFIIFYLEMYFKSPGKHVTEVARQAGKEWSAMSDEDRSKYVQLAEKERMRRCRLMRRKSAR